VLELAGRPKRTHTKLDPIVARKDGWCWREPCCNFFFFVIGALEEDAAATFGASENDDDGDDVNDDGATATFAMATFGTTATFGAAGSFVGSDAVACFIVGGALT